MAAAREWRVLVLGFTQRAPIYGDGGTPEKTSYEMSGALELEKF